MLHLLVFPYWVCIGQYRGSTFCSKLIDFLNITLKFNIINFMPFELLKSHDTTPVGDGQRLSVVLPFLEQFCRQLRIHSSDKLLNAADWTFYASKIKTTLLAYPSFNDIICRRSGIIVRNTFSKFLFSLFQKKISIKSEILKQ